MNPKLDPDSVNAAGGFNGRNLAKFGEADTANTRQKIKRQVRRRLHTSKPYQERHLNVAEARREIVTALKFHRAAMKQANEQQQQQQRQQQQLQRQQQQLTQSSRPNPYYLSAVPPIPLSSAPIGDALNFNLPNQTLGLNLNFHGFNNMHPDHPSIFHSSSSSSPSSSSPTLTEKVPSVASHEPVKLADHEDDDFGYQLPFDQQLMELPDWLNAIDDSCCLHQHFDHLFLGDHYFQDPALPCMEIGEIEGMDDDWLA